MLLLAERRSHTFLTPSSVLGAATLPPAMGRAVWGLRPCRLNGSQGSPWVQAAPKGPARMGEARVLPALPHRHLLPKASP